MIRFDCLPDDMQCLIYDFAGSDLEKIPPMLPTRSVRIADIPVVRLNEFDRGSEYARALKPDNAPPLIIADNHFLDGKHRCFSFRELGVESFIAIDLSGIAEPDMIEMNSMGELSGQRECEVEVSAKPKRRVTRLESDLSGPGMR